ncbi:hypothetical protein B0H16DRAFT_1482049 [Mycena metata]|uniref:RING-type domain-containing protein n=1 Tax=Mycena metata TaxID=1033252 RepID=A0AAD7GV54_9AGAR|nr:hypothetical protein B0H16DRAFT_1482049 [Mycena metata]
MSLTPASRNAVGSVKRRKVFADQTLEEREHTRHLLGMSGHHPPPPKKITRVPMRNTRHRKNTQPNGGYREPRTTALSREDLYEDARLPVALEPVRPSQRCSLCKAVKSHPVCYPCGHSHCYACIRLWLEQDWMCPVPACRTMLRSEPHRHIAEEQALAEAFPNWVNATAVSYTWEGLTFPEAPTDVIQFTKRSRPCLAATATHTRARGIFIVLADPENALACRDPAGHSCATSSSVILRISGRAGWRMQTWLRILLQCPQALDDDRLSTTMESKVFGTWGDGVIPASDHIWEQWEAEDAAAAAAREHKSNGWPRWEDSGGWDS